MHKHKRILDLEIRSKEANLLGTDFRSEVVAANLIQQGYDPEKIMIIRQGAAKRGFSKDIEKTSLEYSQEDLSDKLVIKTNKECIYDILPEGIFHQPKAKRGTKDKEDIIDEIKRQRQEEFFARKFFQPFEVELDNLLVDFNLFETQYDKRTLHANFIKIFTPYWPVLKVLGREQAVLLLYIIPLVHQIRNKFKDIEEAMSLILETSVQIKQLKLEQKNSSNLFESCLREKRLGVDLVLGNTFDDGQLDLKVIIGPLSVEKMEFYLKDPNGIAILNMLYKLFFPAALFVIQEFRLNPKDADFILSGENKNSYLGINTFL